MKNANACEEVFQKAQSLFDRISQNDEVLRSFKFHSYRVMYFTCGLARKAGCEDTDIRVAGLLHDIGKIGISKEILFKPEKLNDLEYQIVKAHSTIGNTISREILGLPRAAVYIRDHHERWDGKGYPRGLEGEEITIQGRIINICDTFDVITIDRRNYNQSTLTYEKALEELKRCAWSQFDGALIEKFEQLLLEWELPPTSEWAENLMKMNELLE